MPKKSTSSWDKKNVRKLKRYLEVNGYECNGTRGAGGGHWKFTSKVTGNSVIWYEHMAKPIWGRIIREVEKDLLSKGYDCISYERIK